VDEKTRTVEGLIELPNPTGELRPGLYIEAAIESPVEEKALFVPGAAVLDYENRQVVFIRTEENTFALRDVKKGRTEAGYIEILDGLKEKDVVATSGSFFLKSELLKKSLGEE